MYKFIALSILLIPANAYAMHISEGILPLGWAALWSAVAIAFMAAGLWEIRRKGRDEAAFKPLLGLMAAMVFIISCMPIPVPFVGTCAHPCGTGISALLVGPFISVVIAAAALLIQALLLAHGGLSTWGANIVSMGIAGSFAAYATFRVMRAARLPLGVSAFMAGMLADWATYAATSLELASGIKGDDALWPIAWKIMLAFVPTQLPLGILEGAMTAGMVVLLHKRRPDLLIRMKVLRPGEAAL